MTASTRGAYSLLQHRLHKHLENFKHFPKHVFKFYFFQARIKITRDVLHSAHGFKWKMLKSRLVDSSSVTLPPRWIVVALFAVPTHLHRLLKRLTSKRWQRCRRLVLIITDSTVSACLPLYPPILLHSWKHWELQLAGQTPWSLEKPLQLMVLRHRALLLLITSMVSLWKNNMRGKQGGDTHGGKDWRSELIPHVPQEENFQAGNLFGRWEGRAANSENTSLHFPALFTHTLLCTQSTWIHLAQLWHHKAQLTFLASTRAPETRCFTETNRTENRHRERSRVTGCSGKLN